MRPSVDLRNNHDELLTGKVELHRLLDAGLKADQAGRSRPMDEVLGDLRKKPGS
jgi:hypothetical protein